MKELIPLTGCRAWAKSNRTTLGHDVLVHLELLDCTSDCPGVQWCPGPDLGGDPPGTSVVSLTQMSGMHTSTWDTQTTEYHFELLQWAVTACHFFFHFDYQSFLWIAIKRSAILSFLTHYPVHMSSVIFPPTDIWCVLLFFCAVYLWIREKPK